MRKKLTFLSILMLLVLALTACAGQPTEVEESGEPAAADVQEQQRVAFLLIQPFGAPFEVDIWDGISRARNDGYASEIKLIEMKEPAEYEQTIRQVAEQGYDVIVSTFFFVKEPFANVAPDFPETKFVLVNDTVPDPAADYPNMRGIIYDNQEGSYVCGVAAAHMSDSNQIGFIGGSDDPGIRRFLAGYEAGAKSVNPEIQFNLAFAGSFVDPEKGRELALSLYERGDDVIMHAANKTGLGLFIAGSEVGKYAVGVDVDQTDLAPTVVICSALSNPGESVYRAVQDAATEEWSGGTVYFGVDDGVSAAALNEVILSEEALQAAQEAEEGIRSGEIEVPVETDLK